MEQEPKTLQEAIVYFSRPENCRNYIVARRWPDGVICPRCGGSMVRFSEKHNRWQCGSHHERRQFTAKTGAIFEDSPLRLDKWLVAMWQVVNCKNGVSSYEIHPSLGVTQKTAWLMDHRIRLALRMGSLEKLSGEVEVDETFIGGKARNMHIAQRKRRITGTGGEYKTAVVGFAERGGQVQTVVVDNRRKKTLQVEAKKRVQAGAALYTDELLSYEGSESNYAHKVLDHAVTYVDGAVHTNTLENLWTLLKRGISGTYVSLEPSHLFRHLDEHPYRFKNRKLTDAERFSAAVTGIVGKHVTFEELIGKISLEARPN